MVSGLTFMSLIHYELIFVSGVDRDCFILLHVIIQFSQHHLLKRLFFIPLSIIKIYSSEASRNFQYSLVPFLKELNHSKVCNVLKLQDSLYGTTECSFADMHSKF